MDQYGLKPFRWYHPPLNLARRVFVHVLEYRLLVHFHPLTLSDDVFCLLVFITGK